jgi:hypothetical protein
MGCFSLSKNLNITHVITNQSADWCGDLLKRTKVLDFQMKMFENLGDCQKVNCPEGAREATLGCVGLRPPRNDVFFFAPAPFGTIAPRPGPGAVSGEVNKWSFV